MTITKILNYIKKRSYLLSRGNYYKYYHNISEVIFDINYVRV